MSMDKPTVSVIVAVYEHFEWLRLVLDGLGRQTYRDFEIIIADDGSGSETVAKIDEYIRLHPQLNIVHSWQPDEGWRKNKSMNSAVRKSTGDYLIFMDGDCVPHPRFVADHLAVAQRGRIFGGRRVEMSKDVSDYVESWGDLPKNYFGKVRARLFRNIFSRPIGDTAGQIKNTLRGPLWRGKPMWYKHRCFWGCNFGLYKSDLEAVNGFDERYKAPAIGEDTDLGIRLENAGMRYVKSSRIALMLHRCHARQDFSTPENMRLYQDAVNNKTTWVDEGLVHQPQSER